MARSATRRIVIRSVIGLACVMPYVGAAGAQDGAALLTFGLSLNADQTIQLTDDDDQELRAGLSVGLTGSTSRHSFSIQAANTLEILGDEMGFRDPSLALNYSRFNADTTLSFDASLNSSDVDGETVLLNEDVEDDEFNTDDILVTDDDGTVENIRVAVTLVTGRTAPFGTESRISYATQSFTGTSDPDFIDTARFEAGTTLRFTFNPSVTLRAGLQYSEIAEDNARDTERTQYSYNLSGDVRIDPVWAANSALTFVDGVVEETGISGDRTNRDEDTFDLSFGVTRRLPNGSVGLSYSYQDTDTVVRDTVTISAARSLSRGRELSGALSLVVLDGGTPEPVLSLGYVRPFATGQFSLDLDQTVGVDDDDNNILRTEVSGAFSYEINALSSLSVNAGLTSIRTVGMGTDDALSAQVNFTYNRALTEDWNFSTGLRHRVTYDGGDLDDRVSTLSLGLDRRFSIRP